MKIKYEKKDDGGAGRKTRSIMGERKKGAQDKKEELQGLPRKKSKPRASDTAKIINRGEGNGESPK